jgi:WD40 repeat protein
VGELGRGGMGVVYKARQQALKRTVALKMILSGGHAGEEDRARFLAEAEAIAAIKHPGIVQVFDFGTHDGLPFFSLEFCEGGSLASKLAGTPMPPRESAQLVEQIARAMQAAHERGIIHRDLKPANVLLQKRTTDDTDHTDKGRDQARSSSALSVSSVLSVVDCFPKITDFGLAKRVEGGSGLTQTGAVMGTPSYMAPEQAEGKKGLGPAADVYALGAILYECLTGRPPFKAATSFDTILQVVADDPVPPGQLNARVPADLETVCLKCLRKEPDKRYASAADLADDLGRFQCGEPIAARPVGSLERAWKWVRRHPAGAGLSVASLVAALALVAFFVSQSFQGRLSEANTRLTAALEEAERARGNEERQKKATEEALQRVESFRYFNLISLAERELAARDHGRADELLAQCPEALRGWEWVYLHNQAHVPRTTSRKHADQVLCVAYSCDGERLASGGRDGALRVRDENLWRDKIVVIAGHTGPVRAVAFSPDGLHLASAGDDRVVRIFELTNKKDVFREDRGGKPYQERFRLTHHRRPVRALGYSLNGRYLASADDGGALWLTQTAGKPASRRLQGHDKVVRGLAFSQDGQRLASAGEDRLVKVWDTATGELLFQLALSGHVSSLVWGKGKQLAAAIDAQGKEGGVVVWDDPERRRQPRALLSQTGGVRCLAASPVDGTLALAGRDGTIRLWDGKAGSLTRNLRGPSGTVTSLAFRPDGRFLASGGGQPRQRGEVTIWDLSPVPQTRVLRAHVGWAMAVAFHAEGGRLASGGEDGLIKVWDLAANRALLTLKGHQGPVTGVAFIPDLPLIASSGHDGTVRLWSSATAKLLHTFEGRRGATRFLAVSADGKLMASGGVEKGKGVVTIWDIPSRRVYRQRAAHVGTVFGVAFSPDGRRLASCGDDQTVRVHEVADGRETLVLRGHTTQLAAVAFSPDGKQLVSAGADRTACLWEANTGKRLHLLAGHSATVLGVAFSSDGKRLGTAGADGVVKLWDPQTGLEACTLPTAAPYTAAVAFSSDRRIASANFDGSVTVWEATLKTTAREKIDHDD